MYFVTVHVFHIGIAKTMDTSCDIILNYLLSVTVKYAKYDKVRCEPHG